MAVPKRKISKSRRGMRRAHQAVKTTSSSDCSNCGAVTLPHRVCLSCGYYKGSEIITVNQE